MSSFWNNYVRGKYISILFYGGYIKEKTQREVDMLRPLGKRIAHFSCIFKTYIMIGDLKMLAQCKYNLSKLPNWSYTCEIIMSAVRKINSCY